jgi:hypothetical protein
MFAIIAQNFYWEKWRSVKQGANCGPVAQVVEHLTFNHWVEGSNPSGLTISYKYALLFEFGRKRDLKSRPKNRIAIKMNATRHSLAEGWMEIRLKCPKAYAQS